MKNEILGLRKKSVVRAALIASASLAAVASMATQAAVVDSGPVSIAIPATTAGIYLNVVTGVSGTAAGTPGWDFNPWGATARQFFWPSAPAGTSGGDATGTVYRLLAAGDTVGPTSTFITTSSTAAAANFNTGTPGPKTIGFRFNNEAGGTLHYGYAVVDSAEADGVPGTIVRYVFESTPNTALTVAGGATAPGFAYTPATGSTVPFSGSTTVGGTANGSITVALGTPVGSGTGAAATTTLTCTPPTAPFTGFGQTITAIGSGAISGTTLSGSCTVAAAVATQTLTCNENRGGTANARTWTLSCPAAVIPVTSVPVSGTSIALTRTVGGPAATSNIVFTNPGAAASALACTFSGAGAAAFSTTNPNPSVPAGGTATVPVSYTSATVGTATATLTCTGAQTFTFTLNGTTQAQAPTSVSVFHGKGLLALLALVFGLGLATLLVRRH